MKIYFLEERLNKLGPDEVERASKEIRSDEMERALKAVRCDWYLCFCYLKFDTYSFSLPNDPHI